MPLLVMAKKYSFGYACADMRCSLLVFGVANTRGHEDRWHANCGEGLVRKRKQGGKRYKDTHDLVSAFSVECS